VLGAEAALQPGSVAFDPVRITLSAAALGLSGYELERLLRVEQAVAIEAADPRNIVVNVTFGDTPASIDRLVAACAAVAAGVVTAGPAAAEAGGGASSGLGPRDGHEVQSGLGPRYGHEGRGDPGPRYGRQVCSPREAFFAPTETLPLASCVGRVSAEMVVPYPPGIPVLGPGEEVTAETAAYLARAAASGVLVHGPRDATLATLGVVARS